MIGNLLKAAVVIIIVLALWKLAGGTPDGVAGLLENIVTQVGSFLNSIATKVADFLGHFLGGGASE